MAAENLVKAPLATYVEAQEIIWSTDMGFLLAALTIDITYSADMGDNTWRTYAALTRNSPQNMDWQKMVTIANHLPNMYKFVPSSSI